VRRTGEKIFGVVAIVAGIGLIAAAIAGVEVSSVVLIFDSAGGYRLEHLSLRRRPASPMGREAPRRLGRSRGAVAGLVVIDCEDDQTLRAMLLGMLREANRSTRGSSAEA
jgi:hypothetical protein